MLRLSVPSAEARFAERDVMQATDDALLGQAVSIKGWVRTKRDQKTFSFVEVNDGSCMKGVQVRI